VRIQPGPRLLRREGWLERCDGKRYRQGYREGYRKAQRRGTAETPEGPATQCLNWRRDPAGRRAFLNGKGFAE
jgi:hypothetical protein